MKLIKRYSNQVFIYLLIIYILKMKDKIYIIYISSINYIYINIIENKYYKLFFLKKIGDTVQISYVSTRDDTGEVHVAIVCSDCYEDSPSSHKLPEADQFVNGSKGYVTVQIPQTAKRGAEIYYCFVVGYRNSNQEWETTKAGPIYVSCK